MKSISENGGYANSRNVKDSGSRYVEKHSYHCAGKSIISKRKLGNEISQGTSSSLRSKDRSRAGRSKMHTNNEDTSEEVENIIWIEEACGPDKTVSEDQKLNLSKLLDSKSRHGVKDIITEAIDEGHKLFTKVGYENQLMKWIKHVFEAKPDNPHEYLKKLLTEQELKGRNEYLKQISSTQDPSENEYFLYLKELLSKLTLENDLAFELNQIKALCAMIDEENYAIDGRSKQDWYMTLERAEVKKEKLKTRQEMDEMSRAEEKLEDEKLRKARAEEVKKAMRIGQAQKDLKLWREYESPVLVPPSEETKTLRDDGRIKDWFLCLQGYNKDGQSELIQSLSN